MDVPKTLAEIETHLLKHGRLHEAELIFEVRKNMLCKKGNNQQNSEQEARNE